MQRLYFYSAIVLILFAAGCASGPKHLTAQEFENLYLINQGNSLKSYTYVGETNGAVYMLQEKVPLLYGKNRLKTFFTETNDLSADFLEKMRRDADAMKNARAQ